MPLTAWADVAINETNFPDANFRAWLTAQDYGKDGVLTDREIGKIMSIDVHEMGIGSLEGINFFTALREFSCSGNQLTSLDISGCTALTRLYCSGNQLTALDVSGCTALWDLECYDNQLTALDVSGCTALGTFFCYNNQLTSLDVSANTALTDLRCNGNQLTSLDVSGCTALESLYCYDNQLMSLDVSGCTTLQQLYCYNNQLMSLDVAANTVLIRLECFNNQIRGEAMDGLIASLNGRGTRTGYFLVYYQAADDESADGNVCTKDQVAQAKAKNWSVWYRFLVNGIVNYAEYEGSDAERVASLRADGDADAPVYDLSGRRVQGRPKQKGIYVKDGIKILYK